MVDALIIAFAILVHAWVTYYAKKKHVPGESHVHVHPNIHHENKPDRSVSRFLT